VCDLYFLGSNMKCIIMTKEQHNKQHCNSPIFQILAQPNRTAFLFPSSFPTSTLSFSPFFFPSPLPSSLHTLLNLHILLSMFSYLLLSCIGWFIFVYVYLSFFLPSFFPSYAPQFYSLLFILFYSPSAGLLYVRFFFLCCILPSFSLRPKNT
jgi:hypothetical protein